MATELDKKQKESYDLYKSSWINSMAWNTVSRMYRNESIMYAIGGVTCVASGILGAAFIPGRFAKIVAPMLHICGTVALVESYSLDKVSAETKTQSDEYNALTNMYHDFLLKNLNYPENQEPIPVEKYNTLKNIEQPRILDIAKNHLIIKRKYDCDTYYKVGLESAIRIYRNGVQEGDDILFGLAGKIPPK